jgi:hypothetical protein
MKRFFDLTFRLFFLFTGFGTAPIGLYALSPEWAVTKLGKLQFLRNYTVGCYAVCGFKHRLPPDASH